MKKTKNLLTKALKCLFVFSIIFSQMSFPLSVLAEEVLENNELNEVVDEQENEQTEANNGEITEEENDATEEDNNNENTEEDETTEEDNTTEEDTSTPEEEIKFTVEKLETEKLYIIKNSADSAVTVKQLKELEETAIITDEENNEITEETVEIISNYQITIISEEEITYTIIILADYDNNGIVDTDDQTILLNQLKATNEEDSEISILESDLNKDEIFNILDVTYPIFSEKTWENNKVATDELENKLSPSEEEVFVEEEIDVDYIIEGFEVDKLVGIQGTLQYNKELLELTKITVNGIEEDILELENDTFAYLLDDYKTDGVLITLTFKALATSEEEVIVAMNDIIVSNGGVSANIDADNLSTSFKISEYGKGGDVEEDNSTEDDTTENDTTEDNNTEENTESTTTESTLEETVATTVVTPTQTTNTYVSLSSDNYINSLTIEGYEIDFDKNTYEYSISVKNSVSSLNLSVVLNDADATYYVEGNEDFQVGENIVKIVVTAENGSTKTYTIKVNKEEKTVKEETEDEDEDEVEEKGSTSKTIIIILIILVIIGLIYVIFKDDEEEEQQNNKNSKNNKKDSKKASKK